MRKGGIAGILLILALVSGAWGHTFLDLSLGSEVFQGSGRCGGMGDVSVLCEQTPLAVAQNPANLAGLARPEVSVAYRFFSLEEDWSFPAHDSFDAILGYTTYSRNSNLYHSGTLAFATGALAEFFDVSVGWSLLPAYNFSYDFHEQIRDRSTSSVPGDKVIAEAVVTGEGDVYSVSVGAGKALNDKLMVGAGLDYLFGDFDIEARLSEVDTTKVPCWTERATETGDTFRSSNLGGIRYRAGLVYNLNQRIALGATMTSKCEVDGDYSTSSASGLLGFMPRIDEAGGQFTVTYPASYVLGVTYRPRNELPTVVEANVKFTDGSEASNSALDGFAYDDTYQWRVGIEHVFYNGRPLRFGFVYTQSAADKETSEAAFTAGSGITIGGFGIEFAGKVGWREYRYFDLFDDSVFCAESRELTDLVEETSVSGVISISRRL
jgi:hypothetical protein